MGLIKEVTVPEIGDFADVEIIEVMVSNGDNVTAEDPLITIETEKASMEIPSPYSGKVKKVAVKVGDNVSKGSLILTMDIQDQEQKTAAAQSTSRQPSEITQATQPAQSSQALETVRVPNIGDFSTVEVIEVNVQVGDQITAEQSLITLESDKASMEIPSPVAGLIRELKIKLGDQVKEGTVIAIIEPKMESLTQPTAANKSPPQQRGTIESPELMDIPVVTEKTEPPVVADTIYASPAIRRFARELGVHLTDVQPTGRKGRIVKEDVQAYVKNKMSTGGSGVAVSARAEIDFSQFGAVDVQPLSRINKLSATNLHNNWVQIPHVTQFDNADITDMEAFRKQHNKGIKDKGTRLTPLGFLMKAAVYALQQYPRFNTSLSANGQDLIVKKYYHIGIAVDTPNGLMVPVIRNVNQKSLYELASELTEISEKARSSKLKSDDMKGNTFTISSLGGIGGTAFTPIINAPDVAILGVSRAQTQAVYQAGDWQPRLMLPLSLSYDHRVIDGALAARFTGCLAEVLTDIRRLLL